MLLLQAQVRARQRRFFSLYLPILYVNHLAGRRPVNPTLMLTTGGETASGMLLVAMQITGYSVPTGFPSGGTKGVRLLFAHLSFTP